MTYTPPGHGPNWTPQPDPGYSYTNQYPPKKKRRWPIALIVAALLVILGCLIGAAVLVAGSSSEEEPTTPGTPASQPAKAAPDKTAKAAPKSVGAGTYLVGKHITAGTYRTAGAADSVIPLCYWHAASDDAGSKILSQGVVNGENESGQITLKNGQYFKTSGCQVWVKQ